MGALVKSVENFQTTFNPSGTGLSTNTVNLTKGQDETNCAAFVTIRHTNASQTDNRISNAVGVEFFDNSGTPACRVHWNVGTDTSPGDLLADVFVVEGGAALNIEQDTISLTGTSATATISSVTQTKACVAHTKAGIGTSSGDDFNDMMTQMRFNSNTQIQVERRAGGAPDWTVYAYTMSSDDWDTEYVEDSWTSNETGPTNLTLSNSVTLANAFIVATYETSEASDDPRDGVANQALTGTTTLTWYRNHGGTPNATGTIGVWVVRATSSEFAVQRFATNVEGQLTTNQTITAVDLDKAVVIDNGNVGGHGWPIVNTTTGSNVHDLQHTIVLTSTTNAQLQRQADTAISGSNNNVRYEIVEFELDTGDTTLDAGSGSYTWTGTAATLLYNRHLDAAAGSYAWTGSDAGLAKSFMLAADSGSYVWTGQTAELLLERLLSAESGAYVWTGQDASLERSLLLDAESGAYVWTGQDVTLTTAKTLDAESGSYTWTGQDADLRIDRILVAESGTYTWIGQDANLERSILLDASPGAYIWTGQDVGLLLGRSLSAEAGSYVWTGQDAGFLLDRILSAESGAYVWTGFDADLNVAGQIKLEAEPGAYTWTGQPTTFLRDYILEAESGTYVWTGKAADLFVGVPTVEGAGRLPVKPKRKPRRYILPDNRVFTDPDRALFELRQLLRQNEAPAQIASDAGQTVTRTQEPASSSQESPASDEPLTASMVSSAVQELPVLIRARGVEAQPIDPQLLSVLFERIDDEEAAILLL